MSVFSHWVWKLKVVEYGYSLKTLNLSSAQSEPNIKPGNHVPEHGAAGAGE